MTTRVFPGNQELTFFPYDPNVIQATSGQVTGVLVKSGTAKASQHGTLIYINASPEIETVLDKVEQAGGGRSKTQPAGWQGIRPVSEGSFD
jgi:predicted enzyme related to lactoylglutathione lyase